MKGILLFESEEYSLWKEKGISQEVIDFLHSINWGGDGARYEHKNTVDQIPHLADPSLICIRKDGELLATAVFCHVNTKVKDDHFNCHYIRYFAASPKIRGKGLIKKLGTQVMELIRETESEQTIFYAYVEAGNKQSYSIVKKAGYHKIGLIQTMGFSRFFPKPCLNMELIDTEADKAEMKDILNRFYYYHAPVHFETLFINQQYFVIRKNGEIVAGCQYHRVHWTVNEIPGLMGKILMNIVPHVPVFNRLFNPRKFEFLAFEGIFFKKGHELDLLDLFEGMLVKENLKSAMMWHADDCPVYAKIKATGKLGILDGFVKDIQAYFMISYKDLFSEEATEIESAFAYTSAFDFI